MDDELVAVHAEEPKLMPFLHLPVQSGSDRVLEAMNRRHTAEDYRRIVARLRSARPDIALSSDIIVGFPGERDEDFAETLRLVTDVSFAQAYSFKYSPRPGTPGATLADQVSERVKDERLAALQHLLHEYQLAFNRSTIGRVMPVLLERSGRKQTQLVGRTPYMQAVHVDAPEESLGAIVNVRIVDALSNTLAGTLQEDVLKGGAFGGCEAGTTPRPDGARVCN
jgi:tRNA-2-methylthio-N6-dimethylallyladenosine synthase